MYLKFIKDHPVGIDKDSYSKAKQSHGVKLVKQGFAEEIKKEEFDEWAKKFYAEKAKGKKPIKKEVEKIVDSNKPKTLSAMRFGELCTFVKENKLPLKTQVEKNGKLKDKKKKDFTKEIREYIKANPIVGE